MLVVMQEGAGEAQIQGVIDRLVELGFDVHRSTGVMHTVLGGVGGKDEFDIATFEVMEGVKEAHRIVSPYKLASRTFRPGGTVVKVRRGGGPAVEIGGERVAVMAGPCSVESRDQIERTAELVARCRSEGDPRRSVQAAHLAIQFPGTWRGRPGTAARGGGPQRTTGGQRGDGHYADSTGERSMPTFFRWARATCRTSICCASWGISGNRCC